jgi:hypothetical protein
MPLDPMLIYSLQPKAAAFKVTDERGLYLEVRPNGAKYWRFRFRWAGKQNTISCGVYPETSLNEARERREEARRLLADGIDPSEHGQMQRAKQRDEQARQKVETRFLLENNGALSFRLGARHVALTPAETAELRTFLDATRTVTSKS